MLVVTKELPKKILQLFSVKNLVWVVAASVIFAFALKAQTNNVGIGTNTPNNSSILDLTSTTRGFLAPRMTGAERIAIATPAQGLLVYQTDAPSGFYFYNGAVWVQFALGSFWSLAGNTTTNPTTDFIGTTDAQPLVMKTNNTERIRILSGGNVGINTTNASQLFEVQNGNILISNSDDVARELIFMTPSSNTFYSSFKAQAQTANINYTLPPVVGSTGQVLAAVDNAGSLTWTTVTSGGSGLPPGTTGQTVRHDGTNWIANSLLINDGTNIGIGLGGSPTQKLEIAGNLFLSNTGTASQLIFGEPSADGTNFTAFVAQAQAADITYTLPPVVGSTGQILAALDNSGSLTWTTITSGGSGLPPGTSGQTVRHDGTNWIANSVLINDGTNIGIGVTPTQKLEIAGNLFLSNTGTASQLIFSEPSAGGTNFTAFVAQAQVADITYTLPSADGSNGQILTTNGTGGLSWTSASGGSLPAGTLNQTFRHDGTNWVANSFVYNSGTALGINNTAPSTLLHIYENTASTLPALAIQQDGTGDAALAFSRTAASTSFTTGLNGLDNNNYEISNTSALAGNSNYANGNKMLRIHSESGSEGIIDFNHQSRARAYISAAQAIPDNTWTKIQFNAENFDEKSEFDPVTNFEFTAKEEGYYQVNARTEFTLTTLVDGSHISIAIYVNGSVWAYGNSLQVSTDGASSKTMVYNNAPVVSDVVYLQAGQTISIYVYQFTGVSQNLGSGQTRTFVSIHKSS
jgi:hypothetical protein